MKKLNLLKFILFSFIMLNLAGVFLNGFETISDPKPNVFGKSFVKLTKIFQINENIDNNHFFAQIQSVAIDSNGGIHIFDNLLKKVIKINKYGKFQWSFGIKGNGPGDVILSKASDKILNIDNNDNLNISDPFNKKIVVVSKDGKLISEAYVHFQNNRSFFPLIDKNKRVYFPAGSSYELNVFDYINKTILKKIQFNKDFLNFLIIPPKMPDGIKLLPTSRTLFYDLSSKGELIIFFCNSFKVNLYNSDFSLKSSFYIWPDRIIKKVKELKKDLDEDYGYFIFIDNFFIDRDTRKSFYISFFDSDQDKINNVTKNYLYKFSLAGKLECVYFYENSDIIKFYWKINNKFYCKLAKDDKLLILKEEEK